MYRISPIPPPTRPVRGSSLPHPGRQALEGAAPGKSKGGAAPIASDSSERLFATFCRDFLPRLFTPTLLHNFTGATLLAQRDSGSASIHPMAAARSKLFREPALMGIQIDPSAFLLFPSVKLELGYAPILPFEPT
jgi:hypothetical protein